MAKIGVIIPTLNAVKELQACLEPLLASSLKPKILVVDSSSDDGTADLARLLGVETEIIPQKMFNHGLTREEGRKKLNVEISVFMTPDSCLDGHRSLEYLVEPILSGKAAVAYGRQIPRKAAGFFESFPRRYNYPPLSHIRGIEDFKKYGVYTFFCSNSFAAYSNQALDQVGGFPEVLFGEDTIAAAKLLQKGYRIAYVADALAVHSHKYSLKQEFKRHFDMGYVRNKHRFLLKSDAGDQKRGADFFKSMLKELFPKKIYLIPYAFLQTGMKWLGYQLGKRAESLPNRLQKALSSQSYYWR